ncbi:MAG TPA: DUF3857 domain-containing protein, partial [Candidatus Babeliaceae bacterium]|nr:DUF3857 domain-containing protein [Candidatus Babeliaceae bacterium]
MKRFIYTATFVLLLVINILPRAFGQEINDDFFKYHLTQNVYPIDSDASAIVLYEKDDMTINIALMGNQIFSGDQVYKYHKIIKVLKSDGTSAGNVVLGYTLDNLKGTTYNLEGSKMVKTELSVNDSYTKGITDGLHSTNFSMPAVKEGSIIEYSYEIKTPLTGDFPFWEIQGPYPKLKSIYEVHFPEIFEFTSYSQSRIPFKEYSSEAQAEKDTAVSYHVAKTFRSYNDILWVRRNIPAAKEEPYISCLGNNIERLELQLTADGLDRFAIDRNDTWERFDEKIWPMFSSEISSPDNIIDEIVDSINKSNKSELARTKAIYSYVRSNFTVAKDEYNRSLLSNKRFLKKIFENKGGTNFDINLILTTMLCDAGLKAAPVILSTVGSLQAKELFPTIDRFNYLIASVWIDSNLILLDASGKYNAFGCLPKYCYNGYARMLGKKGVSLMLRP